MSIPIVRPSSKLTPAQKKEVMARIADQRVLPATPKMSTLPMVGGGGSPAGMPPTLNNLPSNSLMPQQPMPMGNGLPEVSSFDPVPSSELVVPDYMDTRIETGNLKDLSETDKRIQYALIADQIWTAGGGDESAQGDVWGKLRKTSGRVHLESARDYFISSFIKYRDDPNKFTKKHPKEGRIISAVNEAFEVAQDSMNMPANMPAPMPMPSQGGINGISG